MRFHEALDQFMKKHGLLFVMEEGGEILPYRRVYYNPKTGIGLEVLDIEDTRELEEEMGNGE